MVKGITTNELAAAAVTLLILVIIISVGAQIMGETQEAGKATESRSTANQSLGTELVNASSTVTGLGLNPTAYVIGEVLNATDFQLASTGYTFTDAGVFTLTNMSHNNTVLRITFTNTADTEDEFYNTTVSGLEAVAEFSDWFVILVLVLIAVVIIALLVRGLSGTTMGA